MELLAPAGTLEKLKWALAYGADAVYFGSDFGSLRNFAGNLDVADAEEGLKLLHAKGKRGYLTLNIYPWSEEFERIEKLAREMDEVGVDAFIVADLGVLRLLRKMNLKADLHISTQANTTNTQAALAYHDLGAKRVNLARELSIERIQTMQQELAGQIETEVFVHGAVCFSYSGRCAISDYMTGFGGNRGECKQPCRWKYTLMEEKREGEHFPYFEDERGSYFFNSKDLALFEYIPALKAAGVNSVKLEGRMKTIHYIASTVSFYRRLIDGDPVSWETGLEELNRLPNRGYSKGFMKGQVDSDDYAQQRSGSKGESLMVGDVLEEKVDGKTIMRVRNKVHGGETLEVLSPDGMMRDFTLPAPLRSPEGAAFDLMNNPQHLVLDQELPCYSIVRRVEASHRM